MRSNVSSQSQNCPSSRRVLVLTPAGMNYPQELHGRRLAKALRSLGLNVDVGNLGEQVEKNYDWCVLTNIIEILFGPGSVAGVTGTNSTAEGKRVALAAIRALRPDCRAIACCLFDCNDASSAEEVRRHCQAIGIDAILDFGFHNQSAFLAPSGRSLYHFIPNGLTSLEREVGSHERSDEERPIPWVFIGHANTRRVAVVNDLITRLDPRGFVYMPNEGTVASKAVQQLTQRQYETVLRKCRYHIWYSGHRHFGLESERFRLSLLAGCVPIKIMPEDGECPSQLPFDYLLLRESEAAERIRQFNFQDMRRRFRTDFLAHPSLEDGLAKFLASRSLLPGWRPTPVNSQAA